MLTRSVDQQKVPNHVRPIRPDPIRDAASLGLPRLVSDVLSMPASYNLAPPTVPLRCWTGAKACRCRDWPGEYCSSRPNPRGCRAPRSTPASRRWPPNPRSGARLRCAGAWSRWPGYYEWSANPDDQKHPWFVHAATPLWAAGLREDAGNLLGEEGIRFKSLLGGKPVKDVPDGGLAL